MAALSALSDTRVPAVVLSAQPCLAVSNEGPAEHFLFPFRTGPPTRWWLLYVNGSNQARRSSAIASNLESECYTHRTVNHSLWFIDPDTGTHTNTIESTWHHVKVFLGAYNKAEDYRYHLGHYMFVARCRAMGIPPYLEFCISSRAQTGPVSDKLPPPPPPRDALHVVPSKHPHLRKQVWCHLYVRVLG